MAALCVSSVVRAEGPQAVILKPKAGDKSRGPPGLIRCASAGERRSRLQLRGVRRRPRSRRYQRLRVKDFAHPTCPLGGFGVVSLTGIQTFEGQEAEAKGIKHVTILGQWSDRVGEGKTIDIKVYSDFIRGDDPQGRQELAHRDNRMVIRGASGAKASWCSRDSDCAKTHNCCPSK